MKKIDCISAVNVLPGDPLNFPDLDITNLLLDSQGIGRASLSSNPSAEIGRKSMSLGTPFSTVSSSSNALQGSDFAAVISDSDFGSMNDHDMPFPHDDDYQMSLRPARDRSSSSDSMEFQVPEELQRQRQQRKVKRFKNALMDHELMLEKDQLFINDQEMLEYRDPFNAPSDPFIEALRLLNKPDELFISGTFDSIFTTRRLEFSFNKKPKLADESAEKKMETSDEGMIYDDGGFNDYDGGGIEMFRNDSSISSSSTRTPSTLILPWSTSTSTSDNQQRLLSSVLNTPIRKGGSSTPSPLTDNLQELRLTSNSSSSASFSSSSEDFHNQLDSGSSLSQDTFDFFYFLFDSVPSKSGGIIELSSVLKRESTSRAVAARALHHLLELTSANLINVKQIHPFSDIKISIIQ